MNNHLPHPGHDKHMCYLNNLRYQESNLEEFKSMIDSPEYFCQNCGRAANSSANLCKPVKIKS